MKARTISGIRDTVAEGGGIINQAVGEFNALISLVDNFNGNGPSFWDDAGEGVHDWFTRYAPQAFLDWMKDQHSDKFGSVDAALALMPQWFRTRPYGIDYLIRPSDHYSVTPSRWWYSAPLTQQAYAAMGIDYYASLAASPNGNVSATFVPLANGEISADGAEAVVTTATGPRPDNMNSADWQAVQDAAAEITDEAGAGPDGKKNSLLPVAIGAGVLFLILRN